MDKSQSEKVLEYIQRHGSITPLEALNKIGCMRLGARVWELNKKGASIETEMIKTSTGKHIARYYIPDLQLNFKGTI